MSKASRIPRVLSILFVFAVGLGLSACMPSPPSPRRADVAAVVYGGWNGIPVKAWVGGTEQETQYTSTDASGLPAVLWTFYPEGRQWNVKVVPQLPAGFDGKRWQYKLVRIWSRTTGLDIGNPANVNLTISAGNQYIYFYQIVDTQAPGADAELRSASAHAAEYISAGPTVSVPSGCSPLDVSVIVYGGWGGLPVKAWIGGTEQTTQYTAVDASGEQAVLWRIDMSAGSGALQVTPQVPSDLDAARWKYKLLRIESPLPQPQPDNPAGVEVVAGSPCKYVFYFQLVDTGAPH